MAVGRPELRSVIGDADDDFKNWMSLYGGSLVLSTLESGKVAVLGWDGRQVTMLLRQFDCPSGIAVRKNQMLIASRQRLTLYANAKLLAYDYDPKSPGTYDACFLPRASWYVGDVQPRAVGFGKNGPMFVNTRCSCLAEPSFQYHFESCWQPPFVTALDPEDRCHPSGLGTADGEAAFMTLLGETNFASGWRAGYADSGILMDVRNNETIIKGLCLPHSPRWYQGCLWFLNSGAGELWTMNPRTHETKVVCTLPGFARGLDFWSEYAIIGLSKLRKNSKKGLIPLEKKNNETICGVAIINVLGGKLAGVFRFLDGCDEVYDVCALPEVRRAALLTLDKPACHEAITTRDTSWWLRRET